MIILENLHKNHFNSNFGLVDKVYYFHNAPTKHSEAYVASKAVRLESGKKSVKIAPAQTRSLSTVHLHMTIVSDQSNDTDTAILDGDDVTIGQDLAKAERDSLHRKLRDRLR